MAETNNKFDRAIWRTISSINSGQVMSYGEVARAAGYPRHARMVSKAIRRSAEPLPWHRVVMSDRSLAFEPGSEPYRKQQALLANEGAQIIKGKVVPIESADSKDLDEMIWGPAD